MRNNDDLAVRVLLLCSIASAESTDYFRRYSRFIGDDGMTASFDFIAACRPGLAMRTRDRSEVVFTGVDAEAGLIHGEVRMFGACAWNLDGRYRDAPAGAAGPLDLMPPEAAAEAKPRKTIALKDALDPASRSFCCD
jgi:hypothetical protein